MQYVIQSRHTDGVITLDWSAEPYARHYDTLEEAAKEVERLFDMHRFDCLTGQLSYRIISVEIVKEFISAPPPTHAISVVN